MKWSLPVGWAAFSAACASSLVATARFLFPNVLFEPPQSFKAGFPGEYNVGEVDIALEGRLRRLDRARARGLLRADRGLHPPRLLAELAAGREQVQVPLPRQRLLHAPASTSKGPAPRPLERARIVLADDGQILVDKSVKFQQEKGEWDKPEAFLKA